MPPSRRAVLRAGAASLALLAGCAGSNGDPETSPDSTRTTTRRTTTTGRPTTTTTDPAPELDCGVGTLPESGWPLPDRSVGRTNYAPDASGPTSAPETDWSVTVEDTDRGGVDLTRPVVADGALYVGRAIYPSPERQAPETQYVHAYDAETGDRLWRSEVPARPETIAVGADCVLVVSGGAVRALAPSDGAEQWTYHPDEGVDDVLPTPDGLLVLAGTRDDVDRLVALDDAGEEAWSVRLPGRASSDLAWADGRAYAGSPEAILAAVDTRNADVAWTRDLADGDDTAPISLVATPCGAFVTVDGALYGVARDGTEAWSVDVAGRSLATDGDAVYALDGRGYVRSFAAADGEKRWKAFYGVENFRQTDGFASDPAFDGDTLYAGTLDGQVVAAAADGGDERWTVERDWNGSFGVTVVGDTLYVAGGRHLGAFR